MVRIVEYESLWDNLGMSDIIRIVEYESLWDNLGMSPRIISYSALFTRMCSPGEGGGGYAPQILVGICHGKVKKWQGLRNELPGERENRGLRNELEPFWA